MQIILFNIICIDWSSSLWTCRTTHGDTSDLSIMKEALSTKGSHWMDNELFWCKTADLTKQCLSTGNFAGISLTFCWRADETYIRARSTPRNIYWCSGCGNFYFHFMSHITFRCRVAELLNWVSDSYVPSFFKGQKSRGSVKILAAALHKITAGLARNLIDKLISVSRRGSKLHARLVCKILWLQYLATFGWEQWEYGMGYWGTDYKCIPKTIVRPYLIIYVPLCTPSACPDMK